MRGINQVVQGNNQIVQDKKLILQWSNKAMGRNNQVV